MRTVKNTYLFILLIVSCSGAYAQSNLKIGYANFAELKVQLPSYDSLQLIVQEHETDYEAELVEMALIVKNKSEEIDRAKDRDHLEMLKAEHQALTAMLKEYTQLADQELSFIKITVLKPLSDSLELAKNRIIIRHKLDYFYDSSKTVVPALVKATDMTSELKSELGL
jgi:predicted RND superfamily exporter protein